MATNLYRDRYRVESRRTELLAENRSKLPIGTPGEDAQSSVESDERRHAVQEILNALSERDRAILLMQQEGFTHREIAEAVGTTTGSVGTMIARALKRFTAAAADLEALR